MAETSRLIDRFGRPHTNLRISVTDRCNIRCFYCMPSEDVAFMPKPEILSFEEITRVARVFAELGIDRIRITGGEPLVRRQLHELIRQLAGLPQIQQIAITTNAILLAHHAQKLRDSGLDRINVSLDSLDPEQFKRLSRRDELPRVLDGIRTARNVGFSRIRINTVAIKGYIESQIIPLTRFALDNELELRFIEFMPLNAAGAWENEDVIAGAQIKQIIESHFGKLEPLDRLDPSQPARDFRFVGSSSIVGFINSVSEPFCSDCNRLRLTADGKIRNCLFSDAEWDVRALLRDGTSDAEIQEQILDCVRHKKAAHGIGSDSFAKPTRAMYQIGG